MNTVQEVRDDIKTRLDSIVDAANAALKGGDSLKELSTTMERLGRGAKLPHWYETLLADGTLPNLDGKSLGSVLEMVFVAVLERKFYYDTPMVPLRINPARGVDIPSLHLGIKSPSENYCTSEPFFSAYERLLGNDHDAVILLTDYQTRKKSPPLRIQIIKQQYLAGSLLADKTPELKKIVRFLSYVNQSHWEAKALLKLLTCASDDKTIESGIECLERDYIKSNAARLKKSDDLIPDESLANIKGILDTMPRQTGLINAADNWVIETHKDFGRYPNDNEWNRFVSSPLDGVIGMSFALQWRYNFGPIFKTKKPKKAAKKRLLSYT